MRERGNIWPIICVVTVALLVLVLPLVLRHRQTNGRMATVDAQVSIGDASSDPISNHDPPTYRWPDSEVPRTAERLRDVTAVAISARDADPSGRRRPIHNLRHATVRRA